jgi:hypothetical protein
MTLNQSLPKLIDLSCILSNNMVVNRNTGLKLFSGVFLGRYVQLNSKITGFMFVILFTVFFL